MNTKKSNTTKKRFSIGDYIWRKSFDSATSDRGKHEAAIMQEHTKSDHSSLVSPFSTRALSVGNSTALVGDSASKSPSFQSFYQQSFFMERATIIDELTSDVVIDSKTTSAVLTNNAVTENQATNTFSTEPAFGGFKLSPKFIRVTLDLSTILLEQSSKGLDDLIINEITAKLSSALDYEVLFGAGGNFISGIANTTSIGHSAWGALGALSGSAAHSGVVAAEKSLGNAHVPTPYFYLLNANTKARLRIIRGATFDYPIFTDSNEILGYETFQDTNLRDSDLFLISPSAVLLGLWHERNSVDIIYDSWTKAAQGLVSLTVSVVADAKLVRPSALYTLTNV